jgi:hypothetical protein
MVNFILEISENQFHPCSEPAPHSGATKLRFGKVYSWLVTKPQKVLCKSKSIFFETQKESKETKVPKVPAFGEFILFQDTAEWPFIRLPFCGFAQNLTWRSIFWKLRKRIGSGQFLC